jgi:hypothetical protein
MGGNNEETNKVYYCAFSWVDCTWISGPRSGSSGGRFVFTNADEDGCGDEVIDDPNPVKAWGYIVAADTGTASWVAEKDAQASRRDHPSRIGWLPR